MANLINFNDRLDSWQRQIRFIERAFIDWDGELTFVGITNIWEGKLTVGREN